MRSITLLTALAATATPALVWSQVTPVPEAPVQRGRAPVAAASQGYRPLTVERIFGQDAIRGDSFDGGEWTEDGRGYIAIEPAKGAGGGSDIVRYEIAGGARTVLMPAALLVPKGGTPIGVEGYAFSPDRRKVLIFTNGQPFRRTRALGDYWLLDLDSKALRRVGGSGVAPSTTMYAEFSPDGTRIAYVRANNLYVEPVAGGAPQQLTRDGSDLIVNGLGDWVYEEEFGLRKAWSWSPDSRRIAFWRFDTSGVGTFYMIKNTDGQYSKVIPLQYPKAGTTNSAVQVGTVDVGSGETRWFRLQGDPRQNYVPQMGWAGKSGRVLIQYANRLQNTYQVLSGDPATGAVAPLFVERDKAWVEANDQVQWLANDRGFTWMSERDGWRHLYLVSRDGKKSDLRTPGKFDVIDLLQVDEKGGYAYFIASPDNPTQRYLYRATLTGTPRVERVTPEGLAGTHGYDLAPGAHWARHTYSSFDRAPVTDLLDMTTGKSLRVLARNQAFQDVVSHGPLPPTEFFRVDIGGGTQLDAWLIKPANFDPSKRYPILFQVYGEPAGQTVADRWGGRGALWHRMLAEHGYLVASIDPRGVASPRGREWRKTIYRRIGIIGPEDIAAGVRKMLATRPYIDPARVGIWGWSGGGSTTLHSMFRFPDLYSTGIAVAGVADQKLYDSIYQERYMGLPEDNVDGFRKGSPITYASGLKGNLLMVHGTGDDNVHYQNMEQMADALIAAGKPFSMMAYPDRTHGIYEKPGTSVHLYNLLTRYLETNLPAGAR
ncbi:S9 family peptidase [Sphingomonas sp. MA1305]|uniref:S9 family peptidase n=1 Tax=Sphingomonas sp. MA1305 TaxID=2479204 RepID=UPI0018DF35CE|nr:S9 family peptidase [Sphingomonas sp. MA1305]MBI0474297.1 S9 family peptidase [Sphingomonas sp. MA1305]